MSDLTRAQRIAGVDALLHPTNVVIVGMRDGAVGLSTGLIYRPGRSASLEELAELAALCGERDLIYTTHLRSESARLVDSKAAAEIEGGPRFVPIRYRASAAAGQHGFPMRAGSGDCGPSRAPC